MTSIIRLAKNKREVSEAIELICRSFPARYNELKFKQLAWLDTIPEDFKLKNIVLALKNKTVIGVFHVSERTLKIGGLKTKILATTDFCIDKSLIKDKNFGILFFEKGLNILKLSNYPLIMGNARKKLENFYYWYGFTSCNSYSVVEIEKIDYSALDTNGIIKENFNPRLISFYEKLRTSIFSDEWNYFLRNRNFWKFLQKFINNKKFKFIEVYKNKKIIGFALLQKKNRILDFGFMNNEQTLFFGTLFKYLSKNKYYKITFNISPDNDIFTKLGLIHLSYFSRRIPNEGYVAKILNFKKFVDIFCKIFEKNYLKKNHINKKIIEFNTSNLKFKLNKNRKMTPLFEADALTKQNQIELLNILFFGINNKFSIYKLKDMKIKKENYFNVLDSEFI